MYQPNTIQGNKPIAIGHQYSLVAFLPEREQAKTAPWVVPLALERVASQENKELVGARQIRAILEDPQLPFGNDLCVEVEDSAYSKPAFLNANRDKKNLVTITRARGTRTFYQQPEQDAEINADAGHPTWYGTPFCLKAPETWQTPDEVSETSFLSQHNVTYRVEIQAWHHLLMRGKKGLPDRKSTRLNSSH